MNEQNHPFFEALRSRLRMWQTGLLLCSVLQVLGCALVSVTIFALLDFFMAFSQGTLLVLDLIALAGLLILLLTGCVRILRLSSRDMALRADQLLRQRRQPALSAFELARAPSDSGADWQEFLIHRGIEEARSQLDQLPVRDCLPFERFRAQFRVLLLQMAITAVVLGVTAHASRIILSRIVFPLRDIPPYSPLTFKVTPPQPKVLYGGTIELTAELSGGRVKSPVYLLTRKGGHVDRAACFQETPFRFAQRLEKVVDPLEFCFAAGKARSKWQRVELLMQPHISLAKLVITPPSYSQLPRRELIVGSEEVAGFENSGAELFVTSNRPLGSGELLIVPLNETGPQRTVGSRRNGTQTLSFSWPMKEPARLEVRVRDVQGTPTADTLVLTQKIIPDMPPSVVLDEPASFALATPRSIIPISASGSDDLGLRDVGLVRTLVGFRDRLKSISPSLPVKQHHWDGKLDLGALGLEPGQVMELYLEARDFNPSMMGIGSSEIVKIEIISEPEYAALLRNKISIEDFLGRYELVADRLKAFTDALKAAQAELQKGGSESAEIERKLKEARDLNREAQSLMERLSRDFAAFDMEQKLGEVLKDLSSRLKNAGDSLSQTSAGDPGLSSKIENIFQDFGNAQGRLQKEVADADEVAKVARVMRCASSFKQVVNRQKEIVRKLKRIAAEPGRDMGGLGDNGERQAENRDEFIKLQKELAKLAKELPEDGDYAPLRKSSLEFSEMMDLNKIEGFMGEAITAAKNQDAQQAHQSATLALERLESMLSEACKGGSSFGSLCNSQLRFQVKKDLQSTLEQMLSSLFSRGRDGGAGGTGEGGAGAGDSDDGYSTGGHSPLNTPVFGPDRTFLRNQSRTGKGKESGGASSGVVQPGNREKLPGRPDRELTGESRSPELAPEKYRDALKKYFNPETK